MPVNGDPELTPAQEEDTGPYDPSVVPPTSTGPTPSSETPEPVEEPQAGAAHDPEGGSQDQQADPLPEFDSRVRDPFQGLLYLGALKEGFQWGGHHFTIRTLRTQELADVAVVVKDYQGTIAEMRAYQAAVTAACLIDIDGQGLPFPVPIQQGNGDTEFVQRFTYVMRNWFPSVFEAIYNRYIGLEIKVQEVIEAMGKASG